MATMRIFFFLPEKENVKFAHRICKTGDFWTLLGTYVCNLYEYFFLGG